MYKYLESEKREVAKDRADPTLWRATVTVRCKAARRCMYFVWNIFSVTVGGPVSVLCGQKVAILVNTSQYTTPYQENPGMMFKLEVESHIIGENIGFPFRRTIHLTKKSQICHSLLLPPGLIRKQINGLMREECFVDFIVVLSPNFQFMITCLSFLTFAVDHQLTQNRLQLTFTLMLTSVAFKFVASQSLPRISYLTYLVHTQSPEFLLQS